MVMRPRGLRSFTDAGQSPRYTGSAQTASSNSTAQFEHSEVSYKPKLSHQQVLLAGTVSQRQKGTSLTHVPFCSSLSPAYASVRTVLGCLVHMYTLFVEGKAKQQPRTLSSTESVRGSAHWIAKFMPIFP